MEEKLYKLDMLNDLAEGNREFIMDMIQLFIVNTSMVLMDMAESIETKNNKRLKSLAHSIKSNIRTYGISSALEPVISMEAGCDVPDWERLGLQFQEFRRVCEIAMEQMKKGEALS